MDSPVVGRFAPSPSGRMHMGNLWSCLLAWLSARSVGGRMVLRLEDLAAYQEGQVVSRTLAQNPHLSLTLFAFEKGEEISAHTSGGDALVTVLEGTGRFTVGGEVHVLRQGESLVMPAGVPHAVYGAERFKMLLTVVF